MVRPSLLSCRGHPTVRCEQAFPDKETDHLPSSPEPRPSEVVQADDLWRQMLALCSPAHHELLRLKREGISLDEIAMRIGMHKSSVRRVLYDLARRLAEADNAPSVRCTALPPEAGE